MENYLSFYENCTLCPRKCGVNRLIGNKGVCLSTASLVVARAALHMWEEPCISGLEGSGAVFFAGCNMHCIFCQNYEISGNAPYGREITVERLSTIFMELKNQGANNINLVTPTHFIPSIAKAITDAKKLGLNIPIVYNTSGYESISSLKLLEGLVDIYLPDYKYSSQDLAFSLSKAENYPEISILAIKEMLRQTGPAVFDERGMMQKGVIVRHLVLPGHTRESMAALERLYSTFGDNIYISIMSQYTPLEANAGKLSSFPELSRTVTIREYEKVLDYAINLGIKNGFTQEGKAAKDSFIPSFKSLEGV